jgi:general L-amino acid transport system permease protein
VKQALPGGPPRVAVHNNPKVRGAFYQAVALVLVLACAYAFAVNASDNLRSQGFASGFGFLDNTAGFGINQTLIDYSETDTPRTRSVRGGLLNTAGCRHGLCVCDGSRLHHRIARLSPNPADRTAHGVYVWTIRNLPLLFQLLFWYLAVLGTIAGAAQQHRPWPPAAPLQGSAMVPQRSACRVPTPSTPILPPGSDRPTFISTTAA